MVVLGKNDVVRGPTRHATGESESEEASALQPKAVISVI
jgi:hypothetical protein